MDPDDDRPHTVTLVAAAGFPLDAALVERIRARVFGAEPLVLSPGRAVAIATEGAPSLDRLRRLLGEAPVDVFAVPGETERKRLLVADMDGTIVREETLDELARLAGAGERVARITERSMRGELPFAESLRERVATLRGLKLDLVAGILGRVTLAGGARALVATMRRAGARTALVTGGFTVFAEAIASACGFDEHRANVLVHDGVALTGEVAEPVLDPDGKRDALRSVARAHRIPLAAALAVGDGANDVPMLREAGLGVGYRPKPVAAAAVSNRIEHSDLRALLYLQGFTDDEIVEA